MSKVGLITGASAGIGKETAKYLGERGHIVYGAARRVEKMKELTTADTMITARLISKAIFFKQPTRYSGAYMAKPVLFMRKVASDRMMDKILNSQLKLK
jgi:NAD(P)-dependent dehydrogenase (short-subunit alcohol dehydrogenase family)